jgi:pimeloyl-ACP methyl ester carboxylesterase
LDSNQNTPDTIVFIHGLYLTARSWELWEKRYTDRGYNVINQSWPGLEVEVEALRKDPKPIARQSVDKILDHYERIISALERQPIIIGHSFGGAFTQVLISRGLGAAGIAVHSGTVRGVYDLPLTTLRSNWAVLRNPIRRHVAIPTTAKAFRYAFTNTFTEEAAAAAYERFAIPASRNVLFTGANVNLNPFTPLKPDYKKDDRAPLLFIAGGQDHVIPASVNRHNAGKYRKSSAITDYVEFPDRPHFTAAYDGWEEVADLALQWALNPAAELSAASAQLQRVSPLSSPA